MTHLLMVQFSAVLATGMACALQAREPSPENPAGDIPIPELPEAIPLYGAAQPTGLPEQWQKKGRERMVRNVVSPTLIPVLPDPAKAAKTAVIVAPGGGFRILAIDNEGFKAAQWLADHGIAAFLLKYRTVATPREGFQMTMPGAASGGAAARSDELPDYSDAVKDARAAVQLVRSQAAQWKIDPAKVVLLGFSAGAILTLEIGLGEDNASRPDFIAPIYGPLTARQVPADASPMFTVMAADDPIFASRGFDLIANYRAAQRPVEFHLYDEGGHAFGMRKQGSTSDLWIDEFHAWMRGRGLLD